MTWRKIPGNSYWEFNDNPDPGKLQSIWSNMGFVNGVRTDGQNQIFAQVRKVGESDTTDRGEMSATYWNAVVGVYGVQSASYYQNLEGVGLWTPSELSNLVAWYDASDQSEMTIVDGKVSQLNDKSRNNYHATQSNSSNRPETGVTTLNNKNTIAMRDSNKYLDVSSTPQVLSIAGAFDLVSTDASTIFVLGSNAAKTSEFFVRRSDNNDVSFDGTGTATGKFSYNGSAYSGSSANHTTATAPNSGGNIAVGVFDTSIPLGIILNREGLSSDSEGHRGGEIVATSTELTGTDKQKLEGYLAHKWGTQAKLPGTHPFKTSAPIL